MVTVLAVLLAVWYVAAVWLNAPQVTEQLNRGGTEWGVSELVAGTWAMERPVLPAPHQVAVELYDSVFGRPVTSKRSLVYHAQVTLSATVAGFALGLAMGVLLAIGIVHVTVLDRSLMPWIIASQTIPILAIAPMIVVVLGNLGVHRVAAQGHHFGLSQLLPDRHRHGEGACARPIRCNWT